MAPTHELVSRQFGCGYGYYYDGFQCVRRSSWYFWGRWVLLGIAILFGLVVLLSCICLQRRRRRTGGAQPMYGTGWFGGNTNNNNKYNEGHQMNNYPGGYNQGYEQNAYGQQQYPPPYGQPMPNQQTGTTFNPNDGYYSGQQYGVQQPQHAYQPNDHYQAPMGPPPGK